MTPPSPPLPSHDPPAPRYPRAPTHAAWLAMSEAERRAVVDALPGTMTDAELLTPAEEIERIEDLANDLAVLRAQAIESRDEALARAQEAEQQRDDEAQRRADAERQRDDEARRRADAERQRDDEAQRRTDAERRIAALEAELARLRGGG